MNNTNIPHGYDENGVRAGNGRVEVEQKEYPQEDLEAVECLQCGVVVDLGEAYRVGDFSTGYMCEPCASDMGVI